MDAAPRAKLIYHNLDRVDHPDDPSFPFRAEVVLRSPGGLLEIAWALLYDGQERVVVRGMTLEELEGYLKVNGWWVKSPRFVCLVITGPEGVIKKIPEEPPAAD